MSLRKLIVASALTLVAWAGAPARASADWLFTPFIGANAGGSVDVGGSGQSFSNDFNRKMDWGVSLAGLGGGIAGFELDFGYSPNFFRDSSNGFNFIGDGNVTTLMGNLILSGRGPVRPYFVGGVGLIKSSVDSAGQFITKIGSSDFGYDAGGGIVGFISENVGIRGDVRYFRSLRNADSNGVDIRLGDLRFWRGTVGVTFKF